jgi:drug/metabolite transporter (DMT)-like permease
VTPDTHFARQAPARPLSAWIGLIALVAMWGSAFSISNVTVAEIAPFWLAAGRLWVGCAFSVLCLIFSRQKLPRPAQAPGAWQAYVTVGIFGTALPFLLFAWGAAQAPSALMGISNGASPIFTAVLAGIFISSEKMDARRWLGVMVGFIGIIVLVGPQGFNAAQGNPKTTLLFLGLLAGVGGAFCYATANIITKRAPAMAPIPAAVIFTFVGALTCTLIALVDQSPFPAAPSARALLGILALGIFPTGIASIMYVWIVRTHGAVFASLATYLTPIFATIVGVVFLGEKIGLNAAIALTLIIAGVVIAAAATRK